MSHSSPEHNSTSRVQLLTKLAKTNSIELLEVYFLLIINQKQIIMKSFIILLILMIVLCCISIVLLSQNLYLNTNFYVYMIGAVSVLAIWAVYLVIKD